MPKDTGGLKYADGKPLTSVGNADSEALAKVVAGLAQHGFLVSHNPLMGKTAFDDPSIGGTSQDTKQQKIQDDAFLTDAQKQTAKEQAEGINQVNKGVSDLDKVTQANAGTSEELASVAEETASQIEQVRSLITQFKLRDGGGTPPKRSSTTGANAKPKRSAPASYRAPTQQSASRGAAAIPFDDDDGDDGFESF